MTTDGPVFIAPLETVAPVCSRCGQLVWWLKAGQLVDSRGRKRCPAPWWRRLLVVDPHTVEPLSKTGVIRDVALLVLLGGVVVWFGLLVGLLVGVLIWQIRQAMR